MYIVLCVLMNYIYAMSYRFLFPILISSLHLVLYVHKLFMIKGECVQTGKDRDGCPKIVNLGSTKTDLFYERKKYGFKKR